MRWVGIAAAAVVIGAASAASSAATPRIALDFYTPGYAVMCWEDYHEVELQCYTPNDGFTIFMYPTGRVPRDGDEHRFSGAPVRNPTYDLYKPRDFNRKSGGLLQFGNRWKTLQRWYTCLSRRTGLTCRNRSGHGWWIGRYKGYRIF
ncbi:MAG: hypothetical protein ABR583_01165 [Gaiellaceae bacterium]